MSEKDDIRCWRDAVKEDREAGGNAQILGDAYPWIDTLLARVDELESDCAALKVGIEAISSLCDRKEAERDSLKAQRDALRDALTILRDSTGIGMREIKAVISGIESIHEYFEPEESNDGNV